LTSLADWSKFSILDFVTVSKKLSAGIQFEPLKNIG
jgi:hypothetical protein